MTQYIDKDAVVAEIKKIYDSDYKFLPSDIVEGIQDFKDDVLININTLEVKEVDLEEEMDKEWNKCEPIDEGMGLEIASIEHEQFDNIAKHFFELGLKAQKGE